MDLLGYGIGTKDVNEQIQGELGGKNPTIQNAWLYEEKKSLWEARC